MNDERGTERETENDPETAEELINCHETIYIIDLGVGLDWTGQTDICVHLLLR